MKKIDRCAFCGCENILSISIPDSVLSIGDRAFSDCESLSKVDLGQSLRSIGKEAFSDCINLRDITIPESVTEIGENAFSRIPNLIIRGKRGTTAERYANENDLKFEEVSYMDFEIKDNILKKYRGEDETVTIPDGVIQIDVWSFYGNQNVKKVVMPDSVTEIKAEAFRDCSALETVVFSKNTRRIRDRAFWHCHSLSHIELPESMEAVGYLAFEECYSLAYAWVNGAKYHLKAANAPKSVELVLESLLESKRLVEKYYESGEMDEFEYIDYQIAGDGYSI